MALAFALGVRVRGQMTQAMIKDYKSKRRRRRQSQTEETARTDNERDHKDLAPKKRPPHCTSGRRYKYDPDPHPPARQGSGVVLGIGIGVGVAIGIGFKASTGQ